MTISSHSRRFAVLGILALGLFASGCSESGSGGSSDDLTARLQAAEQQLAEADALDIELRADSLPDGITGLALAQGRGYQGETAADAAFAGKIAMSMGGSTISADVIATEGKVWAKTKIAADYYSVKPEQLGAADPAALLGVKGDGLPTLLSKTKNVTAGGRSRDGRAVLTTIEGELPGKLIAGFLPTADYSQAFDVTYRLDDDKLRSATISGPFYPGADEVSYELSLTASDDESIIEPPRRGGGP